MLVCVEMSARSPHVAMPLSKEMIRHGTFSGDVLFCSRILSDGFFVCGFRGGSLGSFFFECSGSGGCSTIRRRDSRIGSDVVADGWDGFASARHVVGVIAVGRGSDECIEQARGGGQSFLTVNFHGDRGVARDVCCTSTGIAVRCLER